MKKYRWNSVFLILLISTLLPFGVFASASGGSSEITVTIDNRPVYFDVAPRKIDDRVMVPLRAIFESLGAEVGWEESTQTATGKKGDITVTLRLNDTEADVNGKIVRLDVAATRIEGRTFVPARFVSESLGADVQWDESQQQVVITAGAVEPESNYYFVYNSQKVTAEDLAAIKLYANNFHSVRSILLDSAKYEEAPQLYDALKSKQKELGGKVSGIQIFGAKEDVPSFPYVHKLRSLEATEKWDGIEWMKDDEFATDFFYSTFGNDSEYLKGDFTVISVFEENKLPISLVPEWPVSRLPLTKGEIADYVKRYEEYRIQVAGKSVPTVVFSKPGMFKKGRDGDLAQDDAALFANRLKDEFGIFKSIPLRSYYDDLDANLAKENKLGIADFLISAQEGKEFVDRTSINDQLNSNYYNSLFWVTSAAKAMNSDSVVHEGMAKGKMISSISGTGVPSNAIVKNYVRVPVEQTADGEWLTETGPATYELLQQHNAYYFLYNYYEGLDGGKNRLQSFHDSKVEFVSQALNHLDITGYMHSFEFAVMLHYFGLADYQ